MSGNYYVTIKGITIKKDTDRAVLIEYGGEEYWIPYSQVEEIHNRNKPGQASIMMSEWIAEQKGIA